MAATTIVLHDEGARRALESALWWQFYAEVLGESAFWDACWDAYAL